MSVGRPTVFFAGGGTGGHLYPGLAVASALRALAAAGRAPEPRCVFLCSERAIDASILRGEGAEFHALGARPFSARPAALARFVQGWGRASRSARALLQRERAHAPVAVVSTGGFVSAPAFRAARRLGLPTLLVNLDAVPGKANRLCARWADDILTAADAEAVPAAWRRIPPIVRPAALPPGPPPHCRERLGLRPDLRTLFVSGGSQGAQTINGAITRLAETRADLFAGWQVFHQAGERHAAECEAAYRRAGVPARVTAFHRDIGEAWGAADLAVARSGAGTVAEVWAAGTPTVFLPYPYHRDNHQRANAGALARAGGAVIVEDLRDASANAGALEPILAGLMTGEGAALERMRGALRGLGPADGAERVARRALELLSPGGGPARGPRPGATA